MKIDKGDLLMVINAAIHHLKPLGDRAEYYTACKLWNAILYGEQIRIIYPQETEDGE